MTRVALLALTAVGGVGCLGTQAEPDVEEPVVEVEGPTTGTIAGRSVTVTWSWTEEYEGGACVDFVIVNHEAVAYNWEVKLLMDHMVDSHHVTGAGQPGSLRVAADGARISILGNLDQPFETETAEEVEVCMSPRQRPVLVLADIMDNGVGQKERLFETLEDGELRVKIDQATDEARNGGDCAEFTVYNADDHRTMSSWSVDLGYPQPVQVKYFAGDLWVPTDRTQNLLVEPFGTAALGPNEFASATVCVDPLIAPNWIEASYEWATEP